MNEELKEIALINEETGELIALIPFNNSENELILKKGIELKLSYDKPFEIKLEDKKLYLAEEIKEKFSEHKEDKKED